MLMRILLLYVKIFKWTETLTDGVIPNLVLRSRPVPSFFGSGINKINFLLKFFLFNDLKRLWFRYIIKLRYRVFNYFIYLFGEFIFYFLAEAGAGAAKMANTKLKMTLLRLCMLRKSPVK